MPPKLTLIGLIVLILGSVFLVLFTFLLPQFNIALPIVSGSQSFSNTQNINAGGSERILLSPIGGHPLWVSIRVTFLLQGSNQYDCNVKLVYDHDNYGSYDIATKNINVRPSNNYIQSSIATNVMPPYSSSTYDLFLEIENNGNDRIVLGQRVILVTYSLFSTVLPVIIAIVGLILIIVGFVTGRKPSAVKVKAAPGWEPTLQWGGGAGAPATKKQPKMAIKSTKDSTKVKKVVKKAAPAGGGQAACKFCGKQVSASAFFCPHCYGKLR